MCVSAARARFRGTTVYCGRFDHPDHGHVEVLGYENIAHNLAPGPNAMLLHLPAKAIDSSHFISLDDQPALLGTMRQVLFPAPVSRAPAEVFDHGVYTVVLAADPTDIPPALHRVPEAKRPAISPALFEFYATTFPRHALALCCFDNRDARRAAPIMAWYEPLDRDVLVAPAIDCHTGSPPSLRSPVRRDHWVIFGGGAGAELPVPSGERPWFVPERIIGARRDGLGRNGDFLLPYDDLVAGRIDRMRVGLLQ